MLSGGSFASLSATSAAKIVAVQLSPCVKSVGLIVYDNGPPMMEELPVSCVPEVPQTIWNQLPLSVTFSLKLTVTSEFDGTPVAPFAGVVLCTDGGASKPTVKTVGLMVNVAGPPLTAELLGSWRPDALQEIWNQVPAALTGSLNAIVTFEFNGTPTAPLSGVVEVTVGCASTLNVKT